jgi:Ca2+/H+ antiporter, TMEM165/GDT1 family
VGCCRSRERGEPAGKPCTDPFEHCGSSSYRISGHCRSHLLFEALKACANAQPLSPLGSYPQALKAGCPLIASVDAPMNWTSVAPAVTTAFLSSLVEAVEALTIVLAVASVRGRRPAAIGALAGFALLVFIVLALGPLLGRIPVHLLQLVIGVLLLLFGMRWLRKAILRAAGIIALHDESIAFATETEELRDQARQHEERLDWLAGLASFKAVVLEGLEVVFIVIAVGAGRGLLGAASLGALAACLVVVAVGFVIHRPLERVPENTLKFAVGVMLSAFGVFWTGEGLGVPWPGEDLAILAFAALFLMVALAAVALTRRSRVEAVP